MSKKTVVMSLCLVAAGATFAGKLYLDNEATKVFNQNAKELSEKNIEMSASSVSVNPFNNLVTVKNFKLDNKNDKNSPVNIQNLEYTVIDRTKGIPLVATYKATGIEVDIREMEYQDADQKKVLEYLAGEDNILEITSFGESRVDVESNRVTLSSGVGFENLGDFNFSFNLDGVYSDIQTAILNKETEQLQKNSMALLGKASLNDISFSYSSAGFKDLIVGLVGDKYTEEEMLKEFNDSIEKAKANQGTEEVITHLGVFKEAFEKDKDVFFEIKVNTEINQELVMSLITNQSKLSNPKQAQELFGIEIVSKIK